MSTFTIYPAIDLKGGQCVRLLQGRADQVTVYSKDPVEMAQYWASQGAAWIHVVDLDGAFEGAPVHTELIGRMADAVTIPLQVGGGMRTDEDVKAVLEAGARRVILGTRALSDPEGLARAVEQFGDLLAVGIDARGGRVQVKGWTETTETPASELARRVCDQGVSTLIYTDTATDGMLAGTNTSEIASVCQAVSCSVIASGGVTDVEDVQALRELRCKNLEGAIVGKALYEERVTLQELQQA